MLTLAARITVAATVAARVRATEATFATHIAVAAGIAAILVASLFALAAGVAVTIAWIQPDAGAVCQARGFVGCIAAQFPRVRIEAACSVVAGGGIAGGVAHMSVVPHPGVAVLGAPRRRITVASVRKARRVQRTAAEIALRLANSVPCKLRKAPPPIVEGTTGLTRLPVVDPHVPCGCAVCVCGDVRHGLVQVVLAPRDFIKPPCDVVHAASASGILADAR